MMRRSLLALAVALLASPSAAQITPYAAGPTNQSSLALIAPTPALPTENSNRIATTQWVNNFVNAGLPLASGKIWIGSVGNIATAQTPSGDLTVSNGGVFTFGTVNANVGSFGSATLCPTVTVNAKGLITAASATTCTPAVGSITGLGTGVATALGVNVGSAGAFVTFNGALGTPSSGTLTSATGLPISTGVSGLAAGCATFLGTATSANLRGCITDESGTGVAYFQGGDLGTPSAGVATNITGINATNISTGTLNSARLAYNGNVLSGAAPSNPTGTSSVSVVHMGLGVTTCRFTPTFSTRIKFSIAGSVANGAVNGVSSAQFRYGTGAGPANAAAPTGTGFGSVMQITSPTANALGMFSIGGPVTGLVAGTAYWFDLALAASTNTSAASNITCSAEEF